MIVLPSGLAGDIRKLKGTEANILADQKRAKKGETFDAIMAGCWLRTEDPGPYKIAEGGSVPWGKVLVCDRFVALMAIRIATYGPVYSFKAHCDKKEGGCDHRFEWEVNLETQLPIFDLPEESRAAIKEGRNRFETEVDGKRVVFKLITGEDEWKGGRKLAENKNQLITTALGNRVVEVDGVNRAHIDRWITNLDLDVQLEMLAAFEKVDGGVETSLEIECPECDRPFEVSPPFAGADFWLPRRQSRTKSRDGRQSRTLTSTGSSPTTEEETTTDPETETT
jgi:hypothetical protein